MPGASIFTHWYLHLPSLVLAVLIYLLLGRLVLSLALDGGNRIMRLLAAVTDPVVVAVGAITPHAVPPAAVMGFAIAWLVAARVAVLWVGLALGVRL